MSSRREEPLRAGDDGTAFPIEGSGDLFVVGGDLHLRSLGAGLFV
jgi:hypothetical protein